MVQSSLAVITLMMGEQCPSEMLVTVYQITWRNIPGDSHLHTRVHENVKSHRAYGNCHYTTVYYSQVIKKYACLYLTDFG
jgi:hypothetical protein